jgi:predicted outer membrane repeat protein
MKYILLLILVPVAFLQHLSAQTRYYVNDDAVGQNNGQSWMDAYNKLHDALAIATAGDEIWVAEGIYKPSEMNDRNARFQLSSLVRLYGGFAGNEFFADERMPGLHPSVLDGDIGVLGDSTDNSYTVLYLLNPDVGTVIDGFTIRNGLANSNVVSNGDPGTSGAGLYIMAIDGLGYPDIRDCVFEANVSRHHGGAVYVNGSGTGSVAPLFERCTFLKNRSANGNGGAMYRMGGSWIERPDDLRYCRFEENYAKRVGGAIYFADSERSDTTQVRHCFFSGNRGELNTDAVSMGKFRQDGSHVRVNNCYFEKHNWKAVVASDQFLSGGPLDLRFDSCTFIRNKPNVINQDNFGLMVIASTNEFGASYLEAKNCIVDDCVGRVVYNFSTLETTFKPAIIYNTKISNSDFSWVLIGTYNLKLDKFLFSSNNRCIGLVDGWVSQMTNIEAYNNDIDLVLRSNGPVPHVSNSTFVNNRIGVYSALPNEITPVQVENCIFKGNKNSETNEPISSAFYYTSMENNPSYSHCLTDGDTLEGQFDNTSILNADPQFVNEQAGDFRLLPCSPGIDAGSNAAALNIPTDLAGAPRILGGTVDMGAYESPAFALSASPLVTPACSGTAGGVITVLPEHGCGPYEYNWQPAVGTGASVNELPPGQYQVSVTDSKGRQAQQTITVGSAESPVASAQAQNVQCGSLVGGSAAAIANGGAPPYSYVWAGGATDGVLLHLSAGQYTVTVTDAAGCSATATATVGQQGQLTLSVDGMPITCFGESDGMLSAAAVNGLQPVQYAWSPVPATDSLLTGLGPGQYGVTATDALGCTASFTFKLSEPQPLQAGVMTQPAINMTASDGTATAQPVSGGTQPYLYNWSNGGTGAVLTGLSAGTYTVTVTDAHGCTATAEGVVEVSSGTDAPAQARVRLWPNPFQNRLELEWANAGSNNAVLLLRDALGREMAVQPVQQGRAVLETSGLPAGAYRWELLNDGSVAASGVVIKR